MNKHKLWRIYLIMLTLCSLSGLNQVNAQTPQYGILHMKAANYATYFNTGIDLKDAMAQGTSGEASFEFWIRSTFTDNNWELTDMLNDVSAISLQMTSGNQLKFRVGNTTQTINLNTGLIKPVQATKWHHILFTVQSGVFRIYVNGKKRGEFSQTLPVTQHRYLFFYRDRHSSKALEIAEVRAWNKRRTDAQAEQAWLQSFAQYNATQLNEQKNTYGLYALLGLYGKASEVASPLASVKRLEWGDVLPGSTKKGKGIKTYGNTTLMEVSNNITHPILENDLIILTATKGNFANKVRLTWPHINGATSYKVFQGTTEIGSLSVAGSQNVGDIMTFDFTDLTKILPGEVDTYKVESQGFVASGSDKGFIFHNGKVSGIIKSASNIPTPEVAVTFNAGASLPGKAIGFAPGAVALKSTNTDVFKASGNAKDFMVEFWYKSATTATNKVLKLGNVEIQMLAGHTIKALNGNGTTYISHTNASGDANWHHYAVLFAQSGARVYIDGTKVAENTTAYNYTGIGAVNEFQINAVAGSAYVLDEFRVWDATKQNISDGSTTRLENNGEFNARIDAQVGKYANFMISGKQTELALYYRFDFDFAGLKEAYNQANSTKGDYILKSTANLTKTTSRPHQYVTYTSGTALNSENYVMEGINFGNTSVSFVVKPLKTDHTFNPVTKNVALTSSTTPSQYTKTAIDFTDESQFNVSGNIYYNEGGNSNYPMPAGQKLEYAAGFSPADIDYRTLDATTDNAGVFNLSLPIGAQSFRVYNPLQNRSFGAQSLKFDGINDFVKSANAFNAPTTGATWSGFIKRSTFSGTVPTLQTVMQIGNVRVVLRNNSHLALYQNTTSLAEVAFGSSTDWQFFAFTYDNATQRFYLYAGTTANATSTSTLAATELGGHLYLGAKVAGSQKSEYFKGNLHLIEARNTAYNAATLEKLKTGNYIAGDDAQLKVAYTFSEMATSLRAVSSTANSQNYSLNLLTNPSDDSTMPLFDATANGYARQYKYDYQAQAQAGISATGELMQWNVTAPVSGLEFHNQTRYGITGNIIIPCNNTLGAWNVTVTRTDVTSPAFSKTTAVFNNENTVFVVDGLVPGIYKVEITNQGDNSLTKTVHDINVKEGWKTVDIEHRNPLQVAVSVVKQLRGTNPATAIWETFDPTKVCNTGGTKYILEQKKQYKVRIEFFEQYGANKCYAKNTEYYISGDLPLFHAIDAARTSSTSSAPFTSATGIEEVMFLTNVINTTPDPGGDASKNYMRSLTVNLVNANNNAQLDAWVTGTLKDQNTNFTFTRPNITQVLYDPPGDGSSTSWTSGSSVVTTTINNNTNTVSSNTKIGAGLKFKGYLVIGPLITNQLETTTSVGLDMTFATITENGTETSTTQTVTNTYSTSSGPTPLPGAQSDVFIGTTDVIKLGSGKTVSVSNCGASLSTVTETATIERGVPFAFDRWTLENTTLTQKKARIQTWRGKLVDPSAETKFRAQIANANDKKYVDSIKQELADIGLWETKLAETMTHRQGVLSGQNQTVFSIGSKSLPKTEAVSGVSPQSKTIGQENENLTTNTTTKQIDIAPYLKREIVLAGGYLEVETHLTIGKTSTSGGGSGGGSSNMFEISLQDDDLEDQFNVGMRKDPIYPTPVIVATSGQSMCPVEPNTVAREGVEIKVKQATAWGALDGEALFEVTISNKQKANEAAQSGYEKTYRIHIPQSKLPTGLSVRVKNLEDNVLAAGGYPYTLQPSGSESSKVLHIVASRTGDNNLTDFTFPLVLVSDCDKSSGVINNYKGGRVQTGTDGQGQPIYAYPVDVDKPAVVYNTDGSEYVRLRDVVTLNAKFHAPCVGNMVVAAPVANWMVNSASNNVLNFKFKPETPHATFSKVRFEFSLPNANTIEFSKDVLVSDLGAADAQGYYTYALNTTAIGADQAYRVRIVPVCGNETEGWQTNTPSAWVNGNIQRLVPLITEVSPQNGSITQSTTATATYNKALNANGVNALNVSLRGILGGVQYTPKSAWFDQTADQITVPDQTHLDLAGSYTVEFWAKPSKQHSSFTTTPIVTKGTNIQIAFAQGNKIYAGQGSAISTQELGTDGWTHVAVVFVKGNSVNTLKIYLNGILNQSVSADITDFVPDDSPLTVGRVNGLESFKGGLDEIRIWSKALSQATIRTNMRQRLIGTEDGLQAYFVLDGNPLNGEAIQDFTNKTQGTTQSGISFVEKAEAAPMDVATVIQDIPVTVTHSADKTQLIMQPVASYPIHLLEGALLTATIAENAIKDEFGNAAAGKSWTFRVDGNNVQWNKGNHTVTKTAGSSASFDLSLNSTHASDVTYELTEMPMWLSVTNAATPSNGVYTLSSGHTHPMTFTTASWMSAGTYYGQVTAKISDPTDGSILGYETVDIKAIVNCDASHLVVNAANFAYQMSANFTIEKAGVAYTDAVGKTVLVRNSTGTLVGTGTINLVGSEAKVSLNIYSNATTDTYTVYLWDDTACQENPIGTGSFASGGSVTTTLDIDYTGTSQYTVKLGVTGYHWVSFRASDAQNGTTLALANITGFGNGDVISEQGMGATKSATFDGTSWSGTLTMLEVTKSYQVQIQAARTLQIKGYRVKTSQTINLTANPGNGDDTDNNPLGYTRSDAMSVTQVMSRLSPDASVGDVITSREGNAQYTLVNGVGAWVGSLTHLIANQGYKFKVTSASTIRYSSVSNAGGARISNQVATPIKEVMADAQRLQIKVNPYAYAHANHITGTLENSETLKNERDYIIVAFAGDEVRGVAIPQQINGQWYYFLTVYTNRASEALSFELIERNSGVKLSLDNALTVKAASLEGSVAQPYVFRLSKQFTQAAQVGEVGLQLLQNRPNPVAGGFTTIEYVLPTDGKVTLTITNTLGQMVKTLVNITQTAGRHQVTWDTSTQGGGKATKGLYYYTLKTAQGSLTKRLIIQ